MMDATEALRDLAGELWPDATRPRFTVSARGWPAHLAAQGINHYRDEQGVMHFTLTFDGNVRERSSHE